MILGTCVLGRGKKERLDLMIVNMLIKYTVKQYQYNLLYDLNKSYGWFHWSFGVNAIIVVTQCLKEQWLIKLNFILFYIVQLRF